MNPSEVNDDGKWSNCCVLFNDGSYSVVSGEHQGKSRLGERWNVLDGWLLGFPVNEKGRPAWHLVPAFLEIQLLHALLDELFKHPERQTGFGIPSKDQQKRMFDELGSRFSRRNS